MADIIRTLDSGKTRPTNDSSSCKNDSHHSQIYHGSRSNGSACSSKPSSHHDGSHQKSFGTSSSKPHQTNTSTTSVSEHLPPTPSPTDDRRFTQMEYDLLGLSLEEVAKAHPYNPQDLYQATDRNLTARLPPRSAGSREAGYSLHSAYGLPPIVRYLAEGPAEGSTIFR
jgi:hypothetical protein